MEVHPDFAHEVEVFTFGFADGLANAGLVVTVAEVHAGRPGVFLNEFDAAEEAGDLVFFPGGKAAVVLDFVEDGELFHGEVGGFVHEVVNVFAKVIVEGAAGNFEKAGEFGVSERLGWVLGDNFDGV